MAKTPETPADELRRIRLRLDYSQEQMARALDILVRRYQRLEAGGTADVPSRIMDAARALLKKGADS